MPCGGAAPHRLGQPHPQMIPRLRLQLLPLLTLACALLPTPLAAQSEGTINGLVVNEATGNTLSNALVAVAGTDRNVTTDRDGRFVLLRIPAGERTLRVSYPGLNRGGSLPAPHVCGHRQAREPWRERALLSRVRGAFPVPAAAAP